MVVKGGPIDGPTSYLDYPILELNSKKDAQIMGDVDARGDRLKNPKRQGTLFPMQVYLMQNSRTVLERGENVIFAPTDAQASSLENAKPIYETKFVRDGTIHGFVLRELGTKRELLKVRVHTNTESVFSRMFSGIINNPLNKYDVENLGLFADMKKGQKLGTIEEVYPDNRIFVPSDGMSPRLEMQFTRAMGVHYYLAVTGISEPIGEVHSDMLGRFAPRSEAYKLALRNCTREEALLWLTMVIATDMKRKKTNNVRWR